MAEGRLVVRELWYGDEDPTARPTGVAITEMAFGDGVLAPAEPGVFLQCPHQDSLSDCKKCFVQFRKGIGSNSAANVTGALATPACDV